MANMARALLFPVILAASSASLSASLCVPGSYSHNGTKPCSPCPLGTVAGAQSDPGLRFFGFGAPGASASTTATDASPLPVTDGLFARYTMASWDGERWKDVVGSADLVGSGRVGVATASGDGASGVVSYVSGGVNDRLIPTAKNLPRTFSICSVSRYTGAAKKRILTATTGNWLHGHQGEKAGVAFYEDYKTPWSNQVTPNTDWVVACGQNGATNMIYVNGENKATASGGTGDLKVGVNDQTQDQFSDWGVHEFATWNRVLSEAELIQMSAYYADKLASGSALGKTTTEAGIILNHFLPSPGMAAVRVYPLACVSWCAMRLGVLDARGDVIDTDDYSATSVYGQDVYGTQSFSPKLDSATAWISAFGIAGTLSSNTYLEVRVPSSDVASIVTQGRKNDDDRVTSYALHYRARGSTVWRDLGTFPGNSVQNSRETHRIDGLSGPMAQGSSGWVEEGLAFDGVDDYVELPSWEMGGATSIEAYFRYASFKTNSRIIDFGNGENDENLILQNLAETGTCRWWFDSDNYVTAENCFVINEWVHIVATVSDVGVMKLYKNGELVGTNVNGLVPNTLTRLHHYVGKSYWTTNQDNFDGVIRHVGVYDRNLLNHEFATPATTFNIGFSGALSIAGCDGCPLGFEPKTDAGGEYHCSLVAPGSTRTYDGSGGTTQQCPLGTAAGAQSDPGLRFFGFGAPGASASTTATDASPLPVTDGLFARYTMASWDGERWKDVVGSADLVGSGRVGVATASGDGAGGVVSYVSGGVNDRLIPTAKNLPRTFSICSVSRYTGAAKKRILSATTGNWLHGHYGAWAGVAHYGAWKTPTSNQVTPNTDWVVACGQNGATNMIYVNGENKASASRGTGDLKVGVNDQTQDQFSDWGVHEFATWDRVLSEAELVEMSAYYADKLASGSALGKNTTEAGIILNHFLPSPDTAAVRVYPLACVSTCAMRLGVLDARGDVIDTDDYSATSVYDQDVYGSVYFRPKLDSASAWISPFGTARISSSDTYLEVRVPSSDVTSIVTQGRKDAGQWVTSYALHYRARGSTVWRDLGTFQGNSDRNTKVTHRIEGLSGPVAQGSSGWVEEGLAFDGVDDSVQLPSWEMGGATSVEAYVRYASFKSWSRIIDFGNGPLDENLSLHNVEETSTCKWYIHRFEESAVTAENCFVINEWVHIVATVSDVGVMKLYKNGELVGTNVNGLVPNTLTRLQHYVGKSHWADDALFDGVIRYVGVYDRNLLHHEFATPATTFNIGFSGALSIAGCDGCPLGFEPKTDAGGEYHCSLVAPGSTRTYDGSGGTTQQCPLGTAAGAQSDPGLRFFGFGAPGASASTTATDASPLPVTDGLFARYTMASWDGERWKDVVGSADLVGSGRVGIVTASGDGAGGVVSYVSGGVNDRLIPTAKNLPPTFSICSVSRYTGDVKQRILTATSNNWLHGHHVERTGVALYGDTWKTERKNHVTPNTNWIIACGQNGETNMIYVNSNNVGTASGGTGDSKVGVNNQGYELSDWGVLEFATWNRVLSEAELVEMSAYYANKLASGSALGKTTTEAGIILNHFLPSPDTAAVRVYPLACVDYCSLRLGVLDARGDVIDTDDYSATSVYIQDVYGTDHFRPKLDSASAWLSAFRTAGTLSSDTYLEVRVPSNDVSSIVTQGRKNGDDRVTSYALHYRALGSTVWRNLGTFQGNSDQNSRVTHRIDGLSGPVAQGSSGWVEEGLAFDGVDDYVELPTWEMGGATSVEAYVRYASFKSWSRIIDFGDGPLDENLILQNVEETSTCKWYIHRFGESAVTVDNYFVINEWVHIVATVSDVGVMKLYKNGELVGTNANGLVPKTLTRLHHYVGKSHWADDALFDGVIRYVGVYDREVVYREDGATILNIGLAGAFSLDICEMVPPGYSLCSNGVWDATACSRVAPGYYNDGSGPQPCPSGRWSSLFGLSAGGECGVCPAGKWSSATGLSSICEDSCPAGKWSSLVGLTSEDACEGRGCPAGTYSTSVGVSEEADCENRNCRGIAYYCPAGSSAPLEVSPNHYTTPEDNFLRSRTGQLPCPVGQFCGGGARSFVPPGYYLNENEDRLVCPSGSYCINNTKSDCSPGSYCEVGSSIDLLCPVGFFCPSPTEKVECYEGQYCPEGVQTPRACPAGETATNGEGFSYCTKCEPGKFRSSDENTDATATLEKLLCAACKQGKRSSDDGTRCKSCVNGTSFQDQTQASSCKTCTVCRPGFRVSRQCTLQQDAECEECAPGFYSDGIVQDCEPCDGPGEYSLDTGSAFCKVAPAGYKPNEERTNVLPCPRNTFSLGASNTCTDCESGFSEEGSTSCNECSPGQSTERDKCVDCTPGKFSPIGAKCDPCPQGSVSGSRSASCTKCEAGTFIDNSMQVPACTTCPLGEISKAASTNCTKCDAGTWESNRIDCFACVAGRYGDQSGLSNSSCSGACPPGTHSYRYATKCLDCVAGKHAPDAGMEECILCDKDQGFTSRNNAAECLCDAKKYRDLDGTCQPCKEGMRCSTIGTDISALSLDEGFWRQNNQTSEVIDCPFSEACSGRNGSCLKGNEGVMCAVCSEDYFRPSSFKACKKCQNKGEAIATALGTLVAMVVVLAIFVVVNRNAPNGLIRPFIVLVQLLTAFDAPFPPALAKLGNALSVLSIGFEFASSKCAGLGSNYYSTFGHIIAVMVIVTFVALLPVGVAKFRHRWTWSETLRSDQAATSFRDLFVLVLLLHPPVSGKAMEFFRCRTIGGETYLMADYSIKCHDSKWMGYLVLIIPVLVLFSFGTPCIIAYVLFARSKALYDENGEPKPQPLDILFAIYKREAYWFEGVQMFFKLALWSTLVFFGYRSVMQLAAALIINVLQLCVHFIVLPMGGKDGALLNGLQAATLVVMTYINFGALLMNYLEQSSELAQRDDDKARISESARSIEMIGTSMDVLTYGLLVAFGAVAAKKFRDYARNGFSVDDIRKKIVAVASFRGSSERPASSLAPTVSTTAVSDDRALPVASGVGFCANPFHGKEVELAPQKPYLP